MKRVLFVATVESHLLNFHIPFMKLLQGKDYEVHVATKLGNRQQEFDDIGVIKHNVDFSRSPYSPKVFKSLQQMEKLLKEIRFSLVHVHTPVAAFITRLACQRTNTHPVLYTAHGFHFYKGAPLKNWLLYYNMEKLAAHWTDGLITINEEDYKAAQKFKLRRNGKVFFVPGVGVDIANLEQRGASIDRSEKRKELGISELSTVLITVAELIPRKNHIQVLKALSKLNKTNFHYLVVGNGESEQQLKKAVNELMLQDKVSFLGFRRDVAELMASSDIFILTSRHEGLTRALMEAMAVGLPIIATDVRGNRDLVKSGENGYLVPLDDAEQTAIAIERLINSGNLRRSMGEKSKELVKQYDLQNIIPQMEEIYDLFLSR
ncbi:glycosyl transferase family 1 [Coprothermobacter proteolyticus DSM 5265]|uniref:Capsular polysaccharide biosynthesis protein n=2 Tax=Coprothermobacter TaxID=68335 RepID=B5Y7P4_COPPD|nr:glycosyltransferase family 4 protein [Coprothermobacter proteolyticus]ACI17095.1 glycosyl transferase family 1 [Coprothermobacter proteolyticus DSM 5265]